VNAADKAADKLLLAQQELARRILARRRLIQFTTATHPDYDVGWIHEDVAARLERFSQDVAAKKSPRLMLLIPPRHGKSELVSIRLPAWHLGHHPTHAIMNVGYNLDLPMVFSRAVRGLLREPYYHQLFPETQLDPETQSVEYWKTTKGGSYKTAGVGGGLTGHGCNILIIDDPLKNMEEADSSDRRQLLDDWYQSTAYTRIAPGGGVLLVETWWNYDDLAGRLQQRMRRTPEADQFEVVRYPALSEGYEYRNRKTFAITTHAAPLPAETEDEELLRLPETALHESRYSTDTMKRFRQNLFPRIWSALYQQSPVPDEGQYFQKQFFKYRPRIKHGDNTRYYTAWDFAIGTKQQNDYTVGATVAHDDQDFVHVEDVSRFKGDAFEIIESMLDTAARWMAVSNKQYVMGVEDGQIWKSIEPMLRKRMNERGVYPSIEVMKPLTDKLARARPLQGRMQQGRVLLPEVAPWLAEVTSEMLQFPGGAHDDMVDALAWAVRLCMTNAPPRVVVPPKKPSWRDKLVHLGTDGASHMSA